MIQFYNTNFNYIQELVMDFFKRIGTDRHKFKIQFFLKTLQLNTKKLKGQIYVKIKRGDHKVTSQKKISLDDDGSCNFGRQILTFQSLTLFYDKDNNSYQQKQGQISVILVTKNGDKKLLGSFQVDLAQYANSKKQNIEVEKQFGDKLKGILKYDVFIKCLGEASQTSKSTDKKIQPKRQSSLSKFTNLFTGIKNDEKGKGEEQNPQPKKKVNKKEDNRQKSNPKRQKQDEKPFNSKKQNSKKLTSQTNQEIKSGKNLVKRNQVPATQKKLEKGKKKNRNSQQQQQQQDESIEEFNGQKQKKNLVNVKGKKDNLTEAEQSQNGKKQKQNIRESAPQEQKIYFDQNYKKKKNIQQDNSQDLDPRSNKMKRTQNTKPIYESKQQNNNKIRQKNNIDIQLQKQIKQLQDKNKKLLKQNKDLKSQNQKLKQLNEMMNQKLQNILNDRDNDFYQTQRQGPNKKKVEDQRLKILQKEKGELLVKVQKLEQKYKKDFQKYQQKVSEYQQEKKQQEEASKAQIKRLKEQFSEQKQKYNKLMSKYEQKANQTKEIKQRQNDMKQRLASAQNSLSELKLKIGDKLNEANQQGNKTLIDALTLISQ